VAIAAIRCAIRLAQNPINEVDYKKHFSLLHYHKVHKKGAEYRDDENPDSLKPIYGNEPEEYLQSSRRVVFVCR
jgi:hypothetical protein